MSFKLNIRDPFLPSTDSFGGRGNQAGLNHGGQYSVDYVLDEPKRKPAPRAKKVALKKPTGGQRPFMRSAPPVAAPRPTKQEMKKMKSATGLNDVSVDNENYVDFLGIGLTNKEKKEIEKGLAIYTCAKTAHGSGSEDRCNGFHAIWQAGQVKNCGAPVIAQAKQKLDRCAGAQGPDVDQCTSGKADYKGADKKKTRLYVQEVANKWRRELNAAVESCRLGTQGNGERNDNTIYGCTNRDALNFNPSATYDDGSCSFGDDDTPIDGNFDQLDDLINQKLAAFLDGLQGNTTPTGGEDSFGNEMPYGAPQTDPAAFQQPAQAGILGNVNPLVLVGIVALAGLAVFMAQKKPQVAATPMTR